MEREIVSPSSVRKLHNFFNLTFKCLGPTFLSVCDTKTARSDSQGSFAL